MKRKADSATDQLATGLERLSAAARREDWRSAEEGGLTPTQADILRLVLSRAGGVGLSLAAAHAGVSQPTASDAVKALVRKGLLEKRPDPKDGRAALLKATRAGRAAGARWESGFKLIASAIAKRDQALLLGIVVSAIRKLEQQGAISPQRMCLTCTHFVGDAYPGGVKPHHCRLLETPIGTGDLRIDCPEHEPRRVA
ncbi:MAG: helix-turn-helix domain-containing protein [Pseudomonadota bacterium]